jgi:hypothetical protein
MNVPINRALIEQTTFDSATPTGTAVVAHRFEQAGQYEVSVIRGAEVIDRLRLNVPEQPTSEQGEGQPVEPVQPGGAISVDLASSVFNPATDRLLAVPAGGYVAFTAPAGAVRLGATVARAGAEGGELEFDTQRLLPGDLFAVTLIRPGRYTASNTATGASLGIQVTYPEVGSAPFRPPGPASVECRADGFSTNTVALAPTQGIIFNVSTATRIQIELAEPDDGPSPAARPLGSWRREPPP